MKSTNTLWYKFPSSLYLDSKAEGCCKYILPMATCPVCGIRRGFPQLEFPEVSPEKVFDRKTLSTLIEHRWPKSDWDTFVRMREELRPHLPKDALVGPASGFGPFICRVPKSFQGFGLSGLAALVAMEEALVELKRIGVALQTCEVQIKPSSHRKGKLFYIYVPLSGGPPPNLDFKVCQECGVPSKRYTGQKLDAATLPNDKPVFRLQFDPELLVFRKDLVDAIQHRLKIKDMPFLPLETL